MTTGALLFSNLSGVRADLQRPLVYALSTLIYSLIKATSRSFDEDDFLLLLKWEFPPILKRAFEKCLFSNNRKFVLGPSDSEVRPFIEPRGQSLVFVFFFRLLASVPPLSNVLNKNHNLSLRYNHTDLCGGKKLPQSISSFLITKRIMLNKYFFVSYFIMLLITQANHEL